VFQRTTQSFGPILAERAETIGARRVSFGFAAQRFTFDTVEGIDLNKVPAVFTHDNAQLLGGRQDVVTTVNSITASVSQFTTFVTLGVTDHFDVSIAVPVVANSLKVVSDATIQRLGTTNPLTHFFRLSDGETVGNRRTFTAAGSASGLGDVTVRLKSAIAHAARVDLRPVSTSGTGDEMNLLGAARRRSSRSRSSRRASRTFLRTRCRLSVGRIERARRRSRNRDVGELSRSGAMPLAQRCVINSHFTLVFDLLGRYVIDARTAPSQDFHALDASVYQNVTFRRDSFQMLNGSISAKVNVFGHLLVDANLLFSLDSHGVRDKITPLVGFEYSF
jgi:hypothetical protein